MNFFKRIFGRAACDPDLDLEPIRFKVAFDVAIIPSKGKSARAPKTIEIKGIPIEAPAPTVPVVPSKGKKTRRSKKIEAPALSHCSEVKIHQPEPEPIKTPDPIGLAMEITSPMSLARDLATLRTIVPSRTPKPILKSIILETFQDSTVKAYATDLEHAIALELTGVIGTHPGKVCIDLDSLTRATKAPKGNRIMLEETADGLSVTTDHSTTVLPIESDLSQFPDIPSYPSAWEIALDMAAMQRLLTRVQHATDPGSNRYALGGVCLESVKLDNSTFRLNAVATDGKRLDREIVTISDVNIGATVPPNVLVPLKSVKLLERFKDRAHVAFTIKDDNIFFNIPGRAMIFSRTIEGRFPRYQDVYPHGYDASLAILTDGTRQQLVKAFTGASTFIGNDAARGVEVSIADGALTIKASRSDDGAKTTKTVKIPDYAGPRIKASIDPAYAAEAIACHDAPFAIEFGTTSPVVIRSATHDSIIMPLTVDPQTWNPLNPECKDCVVIEGLNDRPKSARVAS